MRFERTDDVVRITLTAPAELAGLDADKVQAQLVPGDVAVRLDLSVMELIHSGELAALIELHKELNKQGKDFAVLGLSEANRRLLRMTRLDQVLSIR